MFYIIKKAEQLRQMEGPVWFRRRPYAPHPAAARSLLSVREAEEAAAAPGWVERAWPETLPGDDGQLLFETDGELGQELRLAARARGQAPEALAAELIARGLEQEARRSHAEAVLGALTRREGQVAWLAAAGHTNRQIAEALFVSPETVKTHIAHILQKLGVRSKVDLRVFVVDLELHGPQAPGEDEARPPGKDGARR
jgi:DNA-binding CsgD family transcriptional regulator